MAQRIRIGDEEIVDGGDVDLDIENVRLADGTRLTEDVAEALADEVLRSTGRGRPSLTAPGERSPQLRVSVPVELHQRLSTRANDEHRSVSELTREALERYLAS
ncbi:MAG: ribbon-helix-helix protein, CopG family [Pseudonocardiales bacterium]